MRADFCYLCTDSAYILLSVSFTDVWGGHSRLYRYTELVVENIPSKSAAPCYVMLRSLGDDKDAILIQ